ncbi:MAG: plasma-membrane proton-efflux P-type ATPase [Verrucomicrobia bacterium]|nr:plasma-membrane proton-efflux P-type ATPase [Verrucomicrobiota bacterium]
MDDLKGLTSEEVLQRLQKYGPNTLPEEKHNPFILFLQKFWGPIPWLLGIIVIFEIVLGHAAEAWIIAALLLFNAFVSFFQEGKAKNALRLLRDRLDVRGRVLRDGQWQLISAQRLVPDDIILIRMGDIVPADATLLHGDVLIDQSAMTGESLPIEPSIGDYVYAGSIVKHGEAYAKVSATGTNTYFGKTAEIMRSTKTPSHLQRTIFSIVKYLVLFDIVLILFAFAYALYQGIPLSDIIPFSLLLLIASVPVALPATYTLSTALGSVELAKKGVLVTRLSAIEEAAAMNILCVDKTGTITQNTLEVSALRSFAPYTDGDLMVLASIACEEATQDPLDLAILKTMQTYRSTYGEAKKVQFIPFDPNKKYSEATANYHDQELHIVKGAPWELVKMIDQYRDLSNDLEMLSSNGSRILAVICGTKSKYALVGLIALQDPPRETSKEAVKEIHDLKVKVTMMTGDDAATARAVASQVGIGHRALSREELLRSPREKIVGTDIFSRVFPEDKFHIIEQLQNEGLICGMTGDGVNDAPALKKAEVGIAVSNATDVAKASASVVLTNPGLTDILEAVKTSRRIYQRMLTYTLNKIIKTLQISVWLALGLIITNQFIISQLLIVLFLFANDFVTMSISTDRVSYSQCPDQWDIRKLTFVGSVFAGLILVLSFFILFAGTHILHLSILELRTLVFLTLVFTGQATVYLIRERKHFWHSRPSYWMLGASLLDIAIVSFLAVQGILMAPIPLFIVLELLIVTAIYFVSLDFIKVKFVKFFQL